jgi:MFS transporter, DHA1 family, tetracycline resistance protein
MGSAVSSACQGLAPLLASATPPGQGLAGRVVPAALAASVPPGRLGQTMGAAEVGRELGDAGGPLLVGAFGLISLAAGFGALAAVLTICATLIAPRNRMREGRAGGRLTD